MFFRRVFSKRENTNTPTAPANSRYGEDAHNGIGVRQYSSPMEKKESKSSEEKQRGLTVLQLTPLWEHIIRTGTLPEGLNVIEMFDEFSERLHDPEWQVRQHALRVLVDVLIVMGSNADSHITPLINALVENLGHAAPAVRKGALDALRVYISQTAMSETILLEIIDIGMDQQKSANDSHRGRLTVGVMLSLPSLIQPTMLTSKRTYILRSVINALTTKMIQVTYQEIALKVLLRLKDMIGGREFAEYLSHGTRRDFEMLCNVYGFPQSPNSRDSGIDLQVTSATDTKVSWKQQNNFSAELKTISQSHSPIQFSPVSNESRTSWKPQIQSNQQLNESNDVQPVKKTWKPTQIESVGKKEIEIINSADMSSYIIQTEIDHSSSNSNNNNSNSNNNNNNNNNNSINKDEEKVIMETEIKINQDTAVMMRILEEQISCDLAGPITDESEDDGTLFCDSEGLLRIFSDSEAEERNNNDINVVENFLYEEDDDDDDYGRRTPRRVRFGGEVVKVRTPDSDNVTQSDGDETIHSSSMKTEIMKVVQEVDEEYDDYEDENNVIIDEKSFVYQDEEFVNLEYKTIITKMENENELLTLSNDSPGNKTENTTVKSKNEKKLESKKWQEMNKKEKIKNEFRKQETKNSKSISEDSLSYSTKDDTVKEDVDSKRFIGNNDKWLNGEPIDYKWQSIDKVIANEIKQKLLEETEFVESLSPNIKINKVESKTIEKLSEVKPEIEIKRERFTYTLDGRKIRKHMKQIKKLAAKNIELQNLLDSKEGKELETNNELIRDLEASFGDIINNNNDGVQQEIYNLKITKNENNNVTKTNSKEISKTKLPLTSKFDTSKQLTIDIPNDNTKPLETKLRQKQTVTQSRPNSVTSNKVSPLYHYYSSPSTPKTQSPGRLNYNNKMMSPKKCKCFSADRKDTKLSPAPFHKAIEVMHNLQRSPAISPTRIRRNSENLNDDHFSRDTSPSCRQHNGKKTTSPAETAEKSLETTVATFLSSRENLAKAQLEEQQKISNIQITKENQQAAKAKEESPKTWEALKIVSNETLQNLNSGDWRSRARAITQLEEALKSTETLSKMQPYLDSLLRTLLSFEKVLDIADDKRKIIINLITRLPLDNLEDRVGQILIGLCRQGGAASNRVSKALMQRLPPAAIVLRLLSDEFLQARSSKFRENSLQMVLYALMTFPSTYFDIENCVGRATRAAIDRKKRVRQAALDVLAVLGQISSAKAVLDVVNNIAKTRQDGDHLSAAVKARLSRKQLPIVGSDDSIQYALRIPSPKANIPSYLFGADVEWIIAGSGSVSPNSLKKRSNESNMKQSPSQMINGNFYSDLNRNNNEIMKRFGQKAPHEILGVGVGINSPHIINDASDTKSMNNVWKKAAAAFRADDDRNTQYIVATAMPVQITNGNMRPLYMNMQSRSFPELSDVVTAVQSANKIKKQMSDPQPEIPIRPSKLPVHSRFPAMEQKNVEKSKRLQNNNNTININNNIINAQKNNAYNNAGQNRLNLSLPKNIHTSNRDTVGNNNNNNISRIDSRETLTYHSPPVESRHMSTTQLNGNNGIVTVNSTTQTPQRKVVGATRNLSRNSFKDKYDSPRVQQVNTQDERPLSLKSSKIKISTSELSIPESCKRSEHHAKVKSIPNTPSTPVKSHYLTVIDASGGLSTASNTSVGSFTHSITSTPTKSIDNYSINRSTRVNSFQTEDDDDEEFDDEDDEIVIQKVIRTPISRPQSMVSLNKDEMDYSKPQQKQSDKRPNTASSMKILAGTFQPSLPRSKSNVVMSRPQSITNVSRNPFQRILTPTPNDVDDISSNSIDTKSDIEDEFTDHMEVENKQNKSNTNQFEVHDDQEDTNAREDTISMHTVDMNEENSFYSGETMENDTKSVTSTENGFYEYQDHDQNEKHSNHNINYQEEKIIPNVMENIIKPSALDMKAKSPVRKPKIFSRNNKISPMKATPVTTATTAALKKKSNDIFPSTLRKFDRPKEAVTNCLLHMDSPSWETTITGLQMLVRLIRHHPDTVDNNMHLISVSLAKQVRNLRSQVARAACQAANELFLSHRKSLEQESDDLVSNLLHRTADTNKFLRADATKALETMCEKLPPTKVLQMLTLRGAGHQNAIVRTTTAKLLNGFVTRLSFDKVYAMHKEHRDKLIVTTAALLTEGSLETRNYAKSIFRELAQNPNAGKIFLDIIPPKTYRNIEKTLKSICQ